MSKLTEAQKKWQRDVKGLWDGIKISWSEYAKTLSEEDRKAIRVHFNAVNESLRELVRKQA